MEIELLSIGNKMLEPMLFRVPPKAGSDGSYSHVGEEFNYMLKGMLEIWLGINTPLTFNSHLPPFIRYFPANNRHIYFHV